MTSSPPSTGARAAASSRLRNRAEPNPVDVAYHLEMTEFTVNLANRPGMLAALTETLAAAGVMIEALAAFGLDDEGHVRVIVDNAEQPVKPSGRPA